MRRLLLAAGAGALAWSAARALRGGPFRLGGRVAMVTGGSRGLGLLIAEELARRGCRVAILARDVEGLESARERLASGGADVLAISADVARPGEVQAAVRRVEKTWGPVEVLVNNAGLIQVGPLLTMLPEDFQDAMAANFGGVLHATLAVLPSMLERREGRIANVTSFGGTVSVPRLLPYCASKFAAVGLSEGLRAELGGTGVKVTTVVPGLMRTGSPVNALFKGEPEAEFTWFALGSSLRLTSMDAGRAARRIVAAVERGEASATLGWQARLAQLAHAAAPGLLADALGLVNRLLPASGPSRRRGGQRGMELATRLAPSRLTGRMNRAALRNNEYGGAHRPSPEHASAVGLR